MTDITEAHERALATTNTLRWSAVSAVEKPNNRSTDEIIATYLRSMADAGFVLVPVEVTEEMALAGRKACAAVADRMETAKITAASVIDFWQQVGHRPADEIYAAMVSARPGVRS